MATERQDSPVSTLRMSVGTAAVIACHFIALLALFAVAFSVRGVYDAFCERWKIMLPAVTLDTLAFCRWMAAYWYLPLLAVVPDGIGYFMVARLKPGASWCAAAWAVAPLMLTIVVLAFVTIGAILPLHALSPNQDPPLFQ